MFSEKHQELVLHLFYRRRFKRKEQSIYISPIGFYRAMTYLRCAGMVRSDRVPLKNQYIYELTDKGKLFAIWISKLPDNKLIVDELKRKNGEPFIKKIAETLA